MTAQQLAYALLETIGEFTLTPSTGYSATGITRALGRSIDQAQSQIFTLNPRLYKRPYSVQIPAPESGTVSVTKDSTTVSATTLTNPNRRGNTIKIAGQAEWNAIRTEGGDKLEFAYTGTTGTQAATLYGDVVNLPSTYSRPLGPVWLSDIRQLVPLADRAELLGWDPQQGMNTDWGRYPFGSSSLPSARTVGQPQAYFVDTRITTTDSAQILIYLTPLPDRAYILRLEAGIAPTALDMTTAVGTNDATDPGFLFPIAPSLDIEFLLPVALYHWSRTSFFKDAEARAHILADYVAILPRIEAWRVQTETGNTMISSGWRRKRR